MQAWRDKRKEIDAVALADQDMRAAIAVTRFGLGAKPGEIALARPDPQGFLRNQIRRSGADQPAGPSSTSAQRMAEFREYQRERREVAVVQVALVGEEDVVASGVVAVLGGAAGDADACLHRLVCCACVGDRHLGGGADEHDPGAGSELAVAAVLGPPCAEEGVVAAELLDVV